MRIGVNGVLVSHSGEILLIQRNDTRTFVPPGGTLDSGELPTDGVAREVREETGLIVLPVRLVSLHFWEFATHKHLSFVFRCLLRGGEITPSAESPHVGFYPVQKLPKPIDPISRERIELALHHSGGPVVMSEQQAGIGLRLGSLFLHKVVYPYYDWRRVRRNEPVYVQPTVWDISVFVSVQNSDGGILLCQDGGWRLPGGVALDHMAPWETAVSHTKSQTNADIQIRNIKSVYITKNEDTAIFIFTATTNATEGNWFVPDELPEDTAVSHTQFIQNALTAGDETGFYYLP